MKVLKEELEKLLKSFFLLKEDDWVEWIAQDNDYYDNCDKFNGCYIGIR